jgi:DNA-binding CsgD family transcriptional regulator
MPDRQWQQRSTPPRRGGHDRSIVTQWRSPLLQVRTTIEFHRDATAPRFTEGERRLQRLVVPHLVEARDVNAILYADRGASAGREADRRRALVDGSGVILSVEAGFAEMIRAEFSGWQGPRLPPILAAALFGREARVYRGKAIAAARLREAGDGTRLVSARPLSAVDQLSAREYAVAQAYAAGRTHKEIASGSGVSPATVRNQLQSAYAKLGVVNKIGLARRFEEEG